MALYTKKTVKIAGRAVCVTYTDMLVSVSLCTYTVAHDSSVVILAAKKQAVCCRLYVSFCAFQAL